MAKHIFLQNDARYGITTDMNGKMKGMWSLNTSPSVNAFCLHMRTVKGAICQHCYSKRSECLYPRARDLWVNNYHVLSTYLLTAGELPKIPKDIFRYSAHGDVANATTYKNYLAITEANPQTMFALWTKNLAVINEVGLKKLDNLIYIYSTPQLNKLEPFHPDGFDRTFTVYTRAFIEANGIVINCGGKECVSCRICYTKSEVTRINEMIKSDQKRKAGA